ncbi:unnamed protein product [Cyclocybe aegerita]|uniref:Uncharacterized protein n=1 Tax=Cyclocybe aegerita TaxID=1973307 RepID=A0A8S0XLI5_CYCAE|nr:unnamed protein product [Cyclocybe aegerita]
MAQPVQRSMSYRKPVPVYIPSPPPSPVTSSPHPSIQEADASGNDAPPLPGNWRQVLNAKILEIKSSKMNDLDAVTWNEKSQTPVEELDITELATPPKVTTDSDADKDSLTPPSTLGAPSLNVRKKQSRGLPTHYRPPTPPLPSQNKRRNSTPEPSSTPELRQIRGVYPSGFFPPPSGTVLSNASLKPSSSFRTEKTMVSMGATAWPYGSGSDREIRSYPTLLRKQSTGTLSLSDDEPDPRNGACCSRLFNLFKLKRLWSSVS